MSEIRILSAVPLPLWSPQGSYFEAPIEVEKDLKARILTLRETIENRPRILKCGPEQVTSLLRTDMNLLQIM